MTLRISGSRWRVVLLAAMRLASLYAGGVAFLVLPLALLLDGPQHLLHLEEYAIPIALCFLIAFLLLAVARRAGLVALWLLLAALWIGILREAAAGNPEEFGIAFVSWSTLAIPLALLGGLGVPTTLRIRVGPWQPSAFALAAVIWIALLIPALGLFVLPGFQIHPILDDAAYRLAGGAGWFVWAPGTLLIIALSIAHVWVGTRRVKITSPAA